MRVLGGELEENACGIDSGAGDEMVGAATETARARDLPGDAAATRSGTAPVVDGIEAFVLFAVVGGIRVERRDPGAAKIPDTLGQQPAGSRRASAGDGE